MISFFANLRGLFVTSFLVFFFIPLNFAVAQYGGGLIFPNSDRSSLDWPELRDLSCRELEIARNEIYARRGRYFNRSDLTSHFVQFSWYRPYTWNPELSPVEGANVNIIQQAERARRC